jgi:3-hydroxyisobutyrate dehydrogenase-like beta-hydroxyacid dehydrogenase
MNRQDDLSTDVSVIGLGAMGSALARALLSAGYRTTVWNRSAASADALVDAGALVVGSPAAALLASPLTIMCVIDGPAAAEVLSADGVISALHGKVLAQLGTTSLAESQEHAAAVEAAGGNYLDGGILAYPSSIGAADTIVLLSGDRAVFEEHQQLLRALGGQARFVGPATAATSAYLAAWCFYFAALGGFFEAAALAGSEGASLRPLIDLIPHMATQLSESVANAPQWVESGHFDGDQATVAAHIEGIVAIAGDLRHIGVTPHVTEGLLAHLRVAEARGDAARDIAVLVRGLS